MKKNIIIYVIAIILLASNVFCISETYAATQKQNENKKMQVSMPFPIITPNNKRKTVNITFSLNISKPYS